MSIDDKNNTYLIAACQWGQWQLAKNLIMNKADVNAFNIGEASALTYAVEADNLDMVKFLVENGAAINVPDKVFNPLAASSLLKDPTILKYFVDKVDVNAPINKTKSNLLGVCSANVTQYLIDKKADVNFRNVNNDTPLHGCVYRNDLEKAEILLNNKADITIRDNLNISPLSLAAFYGNREMVKEMRKYRC